MINPRRPLGPRDPNDGWVSGDSGRFWGKGGAAGLLAHDRERGILLQHRVAWSDQGGTWGLPGGARHVGESAMAGAVREAAEEAGVPDGVLHARYAHTFDVGYWTYTTVLADVVTPFEAQITDPESEELRWVQPADIDRLPLHPGFGAAWPLLRDRLAERPTLIASADVAVPQDTGLQGALFGLDDIWRVWPDLRVVLEGSDAIIQLAQQLAADGVRPVAVVTPDS